MAEHVNCSIDEVAKHCHVCESVIYNAFRKTMGTTPNAQRLRLLCERAVELLTTTDRPIEEISAKLGFSSSAYFRKILHKHTGMTPTEIRKNASL
jgi:AraC-like DNA-binding protein